MRPLRTWLPRVIAALAFVLYAAAAPAGPYWLDSSEAAAGAIALATPEAVAYPASLPLASAATLLPFGELAYRVHLLSALAAALAVLGVARLLLEVGRGDRASLVGAAAGAGGLAVTAPFLREATIAGAGAPAAALAALALVFLLRVARGEGADAGLPLALTCGLGLATHVAFALLVPVVAGLSWLRLRRGARWPLLAPLVLVAGAGPMLAYLPLRAAESGTRANHPATWEGVWSHLWGAARPSSSSLAELWESAMPAAEALGPAMIVAAFGGALWLALARRERWLFIALFALVAGGLVAGARAPQGELELPRGGVMFALAAGVLGGTGIAWLVRSTGRAGVYAGAVAGVIALGPAALSGWGPTWAAARSEGAREFSDAALASAPPRGIAIVRSDASASALRYARAAELSRPDLALVSRSEGMRRLGPILGDLEAPERGEAGEKAKSLASWPRDSQREAIWELGPAPPPPGFDLRVERAPFARLVAPERGGGDLQRASEILARRARANAGDPIGARIFGDALVQLGVLALSRGDPELARTLHTAALALHPESADARAHLRALP